MFDYAALERRLNRLEANRGASLRFGTVTEVSEADGTARVQLPDGQNMVSHPLRVMQSRSLKDKKQCFPDVGEPVACLFAGQGFEQGVVLGAVYSPKCASPNQQSGQDYTKYEDGTEIWYDRKAHKLIAKVKGDSEIEAEGSITAKAQKEIHSESARSITLKAPTITLAGLLNVTDKNGNPGQGILSGDYSFINGNVKVPDGDVIAQAVSLLKHIHSGVESGPSNTDKPVNSVTDAGGDPNHNGVYEEYFNAIYEEAPANATSKDKLLLCLPQIAAAEAARPQSPDDAKGWRYLQGMFYRWFTGPGNANPSKNPVPYWVDWNWVMLFMRARSPYTRFTDPTNVVSPYIMNAKAQGQLGTILQRNGYLTGEHRPFDFTTSSWLEWEDKYHTLTPVPRSTEADGLMTALGGFTLRALAAGYAEANARGSYTIHVTKIAVFVHDSFNFEEDQNSSANLVGFWRCDPPSFSRLPWPEHTLLKNVDFQELRNSIGLGNDFLVLSQPHIVETFSGISYEYPC